MRMIIHYTAFYIRPTVPCNSLRCMLGQYLGDVPLARRASETEMTAVGLESWKLEKSLVKASSTTKVLKTALNSDRSGTCFIYGILTRSSAFVAEPGGKITQEL